MGADRSCRLSDERRDNSESVPNNTLRWQGLLQFRGQQGALQLLGRPPTYSRASHIAARSFLTHNVRCFA